MLEKVLKKNNKHGLTLIVLVVTIVILATITGVLISASSGDDGLIEQAESNIIEQKRKNAIETIAREIQTAKLKKKINGENTFTVAGDVIPILEKYGEYNNTTLKLKLNDGPQIDLTDIMEIPMLEYATIIYEDDILTMTSPLLTQGYELEYTPNGGLIWSTYMAPVEITQKGEIYARIKNSKEKVVSDTIKVKEGTMQSGDTTPPTIRIVPEEREGDTIKVTIYITEHGKLDINNVYQYYLSTSPDEQIGGEWKLYVPGATFTVGRGLSGTYYMHVKAVSDIAGNTSDNAVSSALVFTGSEVDSGGSTLEPPVVRLSVNQNTTPAETHTTTIQVESETTVMYNYGWSESNAIEPEEWTASISKNQTVKLSKEEGVYYLWIKDLQDIEGNKADTIIVNGKEYNLISGAFNFERPVTISSIKVTTPPTKTVYYLGEYFNPAGMVVTATYSDNSKANVTNSCTFIPSTNTPLQESNTSITIIYDGKTTSLPITVRSTLGSQITKDNYGDPVNYTANGKSDWEIYYANSEFIYLIASTPLPYLSLYEVTKNSWEVDNINESTEPGTIGYVYNKMKLGQEGYTLLNDESNSLLVAYLVTNYSDYADMNSYGDENGDSYVIGAIGGPTIELIQARANTISEGAVTLATERYGYKINGGEELDVSTGLPTGSSYIWLTSPGARSNTNYSLGVANDSRVDLYGDHGSRQVAPVVCIRADIPASWNGQSWDLHPYEEATVKVPNSNWSASSLNPIQPYVEETIDGTKYYAPIPKGFTKVTGTISTGLVIQDNSGNQFVWVPVNNSYNMIGNISGDRDFHNIEESTPWSTDIPYLDNDTTTALKYWQDSRNGHSGMVQYLDKYAGTYYYSEPDSGAASWEIQEYQAMVTSVINHGGFYVGRYETGGSASAPVIKYNANVLTNQPWGNTVSSEPTSGAVYIARKMYGSDKTNIGARSTLIYGIQWDSLMCWANCYNENATITEQLRPSGGESNDVFKNIYDLAGNVHEWTMEGRETSERVYRGGNRDDIYAVNYRTGTTINNYSSYIGFRVALYIK